MLHLTGTGCTRFWYAIWTDIVEIADRTMQIIDTRRFCRWWWGVNCWNCECFYNHHDHHLLWSFVDYRKSLLYEADVDDQSITIIGGRRLIVVLILLVDDVYLVVVVVELFVFIVWWLQAICLSLLISWFISLFIR